MDYEGHGDHWAALFPDLELFANVWLPEFRQHNHLVAPRRVTSIKAGDAHGFAYDEQPLTALCISQATVQDGELTPFARSVFPFPTEGIGYPLTVDSVAVWKNELEAVVTASWPTEGGPVLTFFDPLYFDHKNRVIPGTTLTFYLSALAYHVRPASMKPIKIDDPEMIAAAHGNSADGNAAEGATLEFQIAGAAMLWPLSERPDDEYGFRGLVRKVEWLDALHQSVARLQVTVIRLPGDDEGAQDLPIDLDLFVPAPAQPEGWQVAVGDEIEGALWLVGRSAAPGPWG